MQFVLLLAGDEQTSLKMTPEEGRAMMMAYKKYTDDLKAAGVYLGGNALVPSATGARVSSPNGKRTVTDGPFAEAKEVIGGYYLLQVKSKEEAIEWASRCPGANAARSDAFVEVREVMVIPGYS